MYYLLPFRFHVFRNQELLTNDLGDYLLLPRGSVQRIVDREVLPEEELYKNLTASFFIYEKPLPRLIDTMAVRLATRKAFLDHFTGATYLCVDTSLQPELYLLSGIQSGKLPK